jgi:glycosyltransferase involved in cell wall biosynthesis
MTPAGAAQAVFERIRASTRPRLLMVTHPHGGGVTRHVAELAFALAGRAEVLVLQPAPGGGLALRSASPGEEARVGMPAGAHAAMRPLLASLGIDRVHFHHVEGHAPGILQLARELACPYDVTLHDYFPACPEYHLLDGQGRFCGGAPGCRRCLEAHPPLWALDVDTWRAWFRPWLEGAQRVIAPSRDCATRMRGFFPSIEPLVWPHPEAPAAPPAATRVLVLGALSPAKGIDLLEACALDAAARGLPLHFRVVGFLARPLAAAPTTLGITGEYDEGALAQLVALERPDAFFFPAQCPESFSYTLSEALATPCPIVATDLGALPERLAGRGNARVLPWSSPPARFNDALLELAPPQPALRRDPAGRVSFDDYAARYLEPLHARPRPLPPLPALEAEWLTEGPVPAWGWTLPALFDDGVRCGKRSSAALLRSRLEAVDAEIAAATERARAAEARVRELEASTSWRLTAPLRRLVRLVRGA